MEWQFWCFHSMAFDQPGAGRTSIKTRGNRASPDGRDFVCISVEGGVLEFAQVAMFFEVMYANTAHEVAFVRWLKKVPPQHIAGDMKTVGHSVIVHAKS
jgi:hypothetical protein